MEIILPQQYNEQRFLECAAKIEYDEFNAKMFAFFVNCSDVDVYQLTPDDRALQMIYGWEACRLDSRDCITEEICHVVQVLAHHSLQLWFSQEWICCSASLQRMLLYFLNKGFSSFMKIKGLCEIDWQYMLSYQLRPWNLPYLQQLFANLQQNKHNVIEHAVPPASAEDVKFLLQERLHLIILRLMKLFDAGSWEAVKQLSLRVLAAWLRLNQSHCTPNLPSEEPSITLVAHLYLLTVFVADDNRGYMIDNMMYNIRFYAQSMEEAPVAEDMSYTPARLIAQVCVRLGLGKDGFFEHIVFKNFNLNLVTSFAVMLEAYTSYVLGNQLLKMMSLNEHDFMANIDTFKVLMNRYVEERENSERFLFNELQKLESQRNSHFLPNTVNLNLNYQQQICKGNRASNIGNYKNCDDDEKPLLDVDEEQDRQIDPVFQNVPNNEEVLEFVYQLLAQRKSRGWQFAKIALLLKIIGQKLNTIEVWRYHPGLTTEFMLNLEHKLSDSYADLAKVFSEHAFMEAEFWLTAFYLRPTRSSYFEVKRCSRIKKKRKEDEELVTNKTVPRSEKLDNIKYELLSSTIDVDEIVAVTNHSEPVADYDPVYKALQALRLPRSILKDLLTVAFQPRNKRYSWALEWNTLHERCSALLKSNDLKRKFVALNMAEANDRLKFLKIDYAKYKNRPQLDYGTIEEGYENAASTAEAEVELSADEENEEAAQKAAKEKAEKERKRKRNRHKFWTEVSEDEEEEEQDSDADEEAYYTGSGRRTRVRAAAVVANAMISDMDRNMRSGRRSPPALTAAAVAELKDEKVPEDATPPKAESLEPIPEEPAALPSRSFEELLQTQAKYTNETTGFKAFADIWSFEKDDQVSIKSDETVLLESNTLLSKFKSLQGLKLKTQAATSRSNSQPAPLVRKEAPKLEPVTSQPVRNTSRSNSDADSLHSGTSTMAMHDANEFDDGQPEDFSGVSKELMPSPLPTSDFTMETKVLQLRGKVQDKDDTAEASEETVTATEGDTDTDPGAGRNHDTVNQPNIEQPEDSQCHPMETEDSLSFNQREAYTTVSESDARLIEECLTRQAEVRLEMLTTQDIEKLRGLRVRLKRTNFHDYYSKKSVQSCRNRPTSRSQVVHGLNQTEDSNESARSPEQQSGLNSDMNKFVHITSDSAEPSACVMVAKPRIKQFKRFKHITSDSSTSTEHEETARPASMRRRRGHKWSQVKSKQMHLNLHPVGHVTADSDVIELSSDSLSSSTSPVPVIVNRIPRVIMSLEMDPLYEEEIVPF